MQLLLRRMKRRNHDENHVEHLVTPPKKMFIFSEIQFNSILDIGLQNVSSFTA